MFSIQNYQMKVYVQLVWDYQVLYLSRRRERAESEIVRGAGARDRRRRRIGDDVGGEEDVRAGGAVAQRRRGRGARVVDARH